MPDPGSASVRLLQGELHVVRVNLASQQLQKKQCDPADRQTSVGRKMKVPNGAIVKVKHMHHRSTQMFHSTHLPWSASRFRSYLFKSSCHFLRSANRSGDVVVQFAPLALARLSYSVKTNRVLANARTLVTWTKKG